MLMTEASFDISKTSIQKIFYQEFGVRKLVSRWILHCSTERTRKTVGRFNNGSSKIYIVLLVVMHHGFILINPKIIVNSLFGLQLKDSKESHLKSLITANSFNR